MKILKSKLTPNHATEIDEDVSFAETDFSSSYPIKSIPKCHLKGTLLKKEDRITLEGTIAAEVELRDSYTDEPFLKKIKLQEAVDLVSEDDGEAEGYIVEGPEIDLSGLIVKLIRSSLPFKVLKPGSQLPPSGEGYSVYSEDEYVEKKKAEYNPAFDALKDFDPDSNK